MQGHCCYISVTLTQPSPAAACYPYAREWAVQAAHLQRATFGAGCFWGPELLFQRVPGVVATEVGYSQGVAEAPTYEDVCAGDTGHTEVVQARTHGTHPNPTGTASMGFPMVASPGRWWDAGSLGVSPQLADPIK